MFESADAPVAYTAHRAEAEMLQGWLREEGIASVIKRVPGFDVPDYLDGGPHHLYVREEERAQALELLTPVPEYYNQLDPLDALPEYSAGVPAWVRIVGAMLIVILLLGALSPVIL